MGDAEATAKMLRPGRVPFASVWRRQELDVLRAVIEKTDAEIAEAKPDADPESLEMKRGLVAEWRAIIPTIEDHTLEGELRRFTLADHWKMNSFMAERETDCKESNLVARGRYLYESKVRYFAHLVLMQKGTDGKVHLIAEEVGPKLDVGLAVAVFDAHKEAFGNPFEPVPKAPATR